MEVSETTPRESVDRAQRHPIAAYRLGRRFDGHQHTAPMIEPDRAASHQIPVSVLAAVKAPAGAIS